MDCHLTGGRAERVDVTLDDWLDVESRGLGFRYRITGSADAYTLTNEDRLKLGTWAIDQHRLGNPLPTITTTVIENVRRLPALTVSQRLDRGCRWLRGKQEIIGGTIKWHEVHLFIDRDHRPDLELIDARNQVRAWTECLTDDEVDALFDHLASEGLVKGTTGYLGLTVKGWQHVEDLDRKGSASDQGFVAMWFSEEVQDAYEQGIYPAIVDAGYRPMRIDAKEHNNKIDDEIIAEIRRSRFVVADFTCGLVAAEDEQVALPRGGVYYEAGFAQGLGIPVIWMCRQDHIEHVHFDTRQFNHITWSSPDELRTKLKNRISAVMGDGPYVSPKDNR